MHASSSAAIQDAMAATARKIDSALDQFAQFPSGCPVRLAEAIRYSLLAPGKRLRPTLVLWSAEACGCDEGPAMAAACAVEMVHCYSLVHDDLPAMDDDDLRRGRPTLHRAYDEATAILAGDALLALAFEVLARHTEPPQVAVECCAALAIAAGAAGLVGGQADDLDHQSAENDLAALERIHERKTGAMIQVSLRIGALVAQATADQKAALDTFGQKLGVAFQIADDVLDVQGQEAELGKRVGKDRASGKRTFPALLGVEASLRRAQMLIDEARAAIICFGSKAGKLEALARYVLERTH
ncbi:MAG: polyprenyl synthetase family protein [Pirellulales bacterium]